MINVTVTMDQRNITVSIAAGGGRVPVLTWVEDQIAIDGVVTGPHLTGPSGGGSSSGEVPVLTWSGDQIAIDGVVTGPHLTGPQGPAGNDGAPGAAGANGNDGADGAPGIDGAPGVDGAPGAAGAAGADGEDGHSPVLTWSGDQIAIDSVVAGPHLTGPQGPAGNDGADGAQGIPGVAGADGAPGAAGADGAPGAAGADGAPGAAGADGTDGADGHIPVLTWVSDQIAIDGVVAGPHLTGPPGEGTAGASAVVLQQSFVSDAALVADTGDCLKLTQGIDFTTAEIGCDVADTLTVSVKSASAPNGEYTEVGTVTLTAAAYVGAVDLSSWSNIAPGAWIRIDLTGEPSAAKSCVIVIEGATL